MTIEFIIICLSMFFWIFPAAKQYRTQLFWYFLVFALMDPVTMIIGSTIKTSSPQMTMVLSFILLLSVMSSLINKYSTRVLLLAASSLLLFSFFSSRIFATNLMILFHLTIIYFFIRRTFYFIANNGAVNIFHVFLLLEEISIVLKILAVLTEAKTGIAYFYATSFFQVLIAIFFTIFKEDDNKLFIDLKNV